MTNSEELRQQLQQAYKTYMQLDDHEQHTALQLFAVLLQKMLSNNSGKKQRLAELDSTSQTGTATPKDAKKARAKLTRKTNAQSPQSPLKPVKTTSKNEIR
jgi:tryptophan synthase beta subunit